MAARKKVKLVRLQVIVHADEAALVQQVAKRQAISVSRLCRRIIVPVVKAAA